MRLSASLLKQWITCPLQAKFARIDHLPRGAQNAKAAFGSCMHHALEHYNLTGDMDGAVAIFRDVWADPSKIGIDGDNMIWPKYITFSKLMAQGTDALKDYHERNKWEKREILGAEYRALVPFGKHELLVIVDCIEAKKSRQGVDSLYIVDYKTNGKAPYPSDLRLNIQFTCYYYATTCKEFWVGNGPGYPGMPNGEELWERFQDAPRRPVWYGLLQNKPFDAGDRDDGDFARLYRVANEIERAITHEVFVPNLSGEACTFCDFTKECRLPFPMAVNSDDPAAL